MLCLANNYQTLMMPPGLAMVQPGPAPQLSLDQLGALALNNPAGKKRPREDEEVFHLTLPNGSLVPYKRQAASDKTGLPVYQPLQQTQQQQQQQQQQFQQLIQMQPNLVPVTYGSGPQQIAIPRYQH